MDVFEQGVRFFNSQKIVLLDYGIGSIIDLDEWNCTNNSRPFHMLYHMISGRIEVLSHSTGKTMVLQPGHAYLIPSNGVYNRICVKPTVLFAAHFFCPMPNGGDLLDAYTQCIEIPLAANDPALQNILNRFTEEHIDSHDVLQFKGYLYTLVGKLLENHKASQKMMIPSQSKLVAQAASYIKYHLSAKLKVKDVAQATNHDANYLSKRFLAEYNVNLKKYIDIQLYRKALLLMTTTDLSLREISEQLQFTDPYYFSKFIKKFLLQSPNNFRKEQGRLRPVVLPGPDEPTDRAEEEPL